MRWGLLHFGLKSQKAQIWTRTPGQYCADFNLVTFDDIVIRLCLENRADNNRNADRMRVASRGS